MTREERQQIAREEHSRYMREWREQNKDKVKAINARYRQRKKEAQNATGENANN